ncbi:GAF domain-containing sensor histidine kinase [bacterium]|nr:GAF domain-containing sensor histidine kinase [bacterium]
MRLDTSDLIISPKLFELYDQMIGEVEIGPLLQQSAAMVQQALDAERATIYLVLPETQELESAAVIGNVSRTIRVPIREDSLAGYCAVSERSFFIPDAYGDLTSVDPKLRFDRSWDEINQFRTRDVLCAPAAYQGRIHGVVQVINRRGGCFSEDDLRPLESISQLIAYSLYHARLYQELASMKALKKEKAKFMRVLVHELKSPAAGAKMLASSLQFVNKDNSAVCKALDKIEGRMDSLLGMVEDILQHSRIGACDPMGEISTFDLRQPLTEGAETYREQAEAKGLELRLDIPEESLPIRFDQKGLELVISNLVSNAVKYTEKGSVSLLLRRDEKEVLLEVSDTGIGIPEKDIPKMCQEFFRATNAKSSDVKGTGVGLAGVKDLVERFGGGLELTSQENIGSTFTVRLPLV